MKVTAEELKQVYRRMSDEELLSLDRSELTDVALQCHDEERARRGLELEPEPPQPAEEPPAVAGTYQTPSEAAAVASVLRAAGIPADVEDDNLRGANRIGINVPEGYRVLVPESLLEKALEVMRAQVSDEELAAEAAAIPETFIIKARYEDGVFVPLEEVEVAEGAVVEVRIPIDG